MDPAVPGALGKRTSVDASEVGLKFDS